MLLSQTQHHNHTASCHKRSSHTKKYGNKITCRFRFKKQLCDNPFFDPATGSIHLRRQDGYFVTTSRFLAGLYRCNTNIEQLINNGPRSLAIILYITDYVNKLDIAVHDKFLIATQVFQRIKAHSSSPMHIIKATTNTNTNNINLLEDKDITSTNIIMAKSFDMSDIRTESDHRHTAMPYSNYAKFHNNAHTFLAKTVNGILGKRQISGQEAAALLLYPYSSDSSKLGKGALLYTSMIPRIFSIRMVLNFVTFINQYTSKSKAPGKTCNRIIRRLLWGKIQQKKKAYKSPGPGPMQSFSKTASKFSEEEELHSILDQFDIRDSHKYCNSNKAVQKRALHFLNDITDCNIAVGPKK